jgi:hypothetical protein
MALLALLFTRHQVRRAGRTTIRTRETHLDDLPTRTQRGLVMAVVPDVRVTAPAVGSVDEQARLEPSLAVGEPLHQDRAYRELDRTILACPRRPRARREIERA